MRFILKLALLPVIAIIGVLWLISAAASRIYGLTHGFMWAILLIPLAIACVLQMWQNAMLFLVIGIASYLLLFALTAVEIFLEAMLKSLACAF